MQQKGKRTVGKPPALSRFALGIYSIVDAAIGRSLTANEAGKGGNLQAAPQSSGSVVVKRYVFNGQVVAMRHDGTLYFLRLDDPSFSLRTCPGSVSLVRDATGLLSRPVRLYLHGRDRWRLAGVIPSVRCTC